MGQSPRGRISCWFVSSVHGKLGGISFGAASWHQQARDTFIGWSPDARVAHLDQLLHNDRFLILPGVDVLHLASHVLARATTQVVDDWTTDYGVVPQAVYTYVAPNHPGTSYRAAQWRCVGRTSGRPPGGGPVEPKAVWANPLVADWRNTLCREPARVLGATPTPSWPKGSDWADMEYRRSSHPDGRVHKRLVTMGRPNALCPRRATPIDHMNSTVFNRAGFILYGGA